MTDDRDVERKLEAWLQDEARPMPDYVLEASIESVARTGQVSAHRPVVPRGWLRDRRLVAIGAMAAVLAVAVAIGPRIVDRADPLGFSGSNPGSSPALSWDAAGDFRRSVEHANPSADRYGNPGVWSYMRSATDSHDPTTYMLLPDFVVDVDRDTWYEEDLVNLLVGANRTDPVISMHPWSSGNRAENHHAILAWRSPITGTVELRGGVAHIQPTCITGPTDGTTLFVDLGDTSLVTLPLDPGEGEPISTRVEVAAGQSLYFVLDPGRASNCDATQLTLSIRQVSQ
jgi:hypothetical protein